MKLVNSSWEHQIIFNDGSSTLLVIEDSNELRTYIKNLIEEIDTNEGSFVLSDEKAIYNLNDKMTVIADPICFEVINKKIQGKILNLLKSHVVNSDHMHQTGKILSELEKYAQNIESDFPFQIEHNELFANDLIKLINFSPVVDYKNEIEKIIEYMNLMHDICGIECFVFIALTYYFDEFTLNTFLHECRLSKHNILMIERSRIYTQLNVDKTIIIDKDLCELF